MPELPHSLRVEAIILRHADWGEADRILTIYAREHGKMRVLAKGVRRLHSRKAGHLEPFTHSSLLLAKGKDFWIATQADTLEAFMPIRDNLKKTSQAIYLLELTDRFTYEDGSNISLFQELLDGLTRLASTEDDFVVLRYFELRFLDALGFRPQFFRCVRCLEELHPEDQFFSPNEGGILCPRCGGQSRKVWAISADALRYFRHYQRNAYNTIIKAFPSQVIRREMETLIQGYLRYTIEQNINAIQFVRDVRQLDDPFSPT